MKLSNKKSLICDNPIFFSPKDKEAFFEWIKKIECVENFSLEKDKVYLNLNKRRLSTINLSSLIGLLYRYKIDMHQLSRFLTSSNKKWFYDNKKAFWHKKVFKK
ncbi:hypothetical protein HYV10_00050 [Candidatus Dependentiae bacterium]|nr:hypothetical protein [Candidatus Dependentiae bacterium]